MSPCKKTIAKKSSKRIRFNDRLFRNRNAFEAFTDFYSKAKIIVEREVYMESLSHTFISRVFRDWTWTKLLTRSTKFCGPAIQEFFSNATVEGDRLNCWV